MPGQPSWRPSIYTAAKYGALYLATQGTTLGMIHEVRSLLEPPLAALLAQRPTKGFLKELEECTLMQREASSNTGSWRGNPRGE